MTILKNHGIIIRNQLKGEIKMKKKYLCKILLLCSKENFYLHKFFQKTLWIFCSDIEEITNKLKELIENDKTLKGYRIVKIREGILEEYDFLIYCKKG